jgi:hypothetical protein
MGITFLNGRVLEAGTNYDSILKKKKESRDAKGTEGRRRKRKRILASE